ncbi:non-canonical purine NTP pyrophosphatase [Paenibacillus sp. CAU 1782]
MNGNGRGIDGDLIVVATKNNGKAKEFGHAFAKIGKRIVSLNDYPHIPDIPEDGDTFAANARIKAKAAGDALGVPALADDSGLRVAALDGAPGVYSARYSGEGATDASNNAKLLKELAAIGAVLQTPHEAASGDEAEGAEPEGKDAASEAALAAASEAGHAAVPTSSSAAGFSESDGWRLPQDGSKALSHAQFVCALALYDPATGEFVEAEGTVDGVITDKPHGDGGFGYDPLFWLPQLGRGMAELSREEKGGISHRGEALRKLLASL